MARPLTSPELALQRSDGQWTKLFLAFLNPNTIYTARLASLPSSNDNVHTISVGTESGTLGDVKINMTAYVGTSAGAFDLGMVRIRKTPITGTWYIGLTSQISWQTACYLTIVDDFDLWAKHAVIDSGALKMDVDVAYSTQHASFNPVPVLRGRNAVLWKTGSTVSVVGNAVDSWVPGSTISSYSWSAPGASATSGLTTATPTFTYNTTGNFRAYCTVTAANTKTTTAVMNIFVFDEDNMPATVFQLAQCVGDYETGGWMFDLTMEDEASLSEIRDRSLVVLFADDIYGIPPDQTVQSIGPIEGRENIVCVGRIVGQSIRWDRESGQVHFTVQGLHHWLNKVNGFPIQLTPATVASNWSQMPLMTVDRVLWHILYWHSTAIETMDFYPTNDTRYTPEGLSGGASIWGQLADVAFSKILASPGVDRFGRLFVEIDPQMVPEASRSSIPVVMALTDDDWQEGIDLQRVTVEDVSILRLTTLQTNSSGGTVTLYSLSPGHTPRRYGNAELLDRVLAATQAQSNQLAGLALGWRINDLPDVPVILLQNNRMFDLFPRQYASLEVASGDTPRGVTYDVNLIPRRISLYFDNEISYMHPELNFEAASAEQNAVNGDIPDVDDDDLTFPPLPPLPPLPPIDVIVPGTTEVSEDGGPPKVIMQDVNVGVLYAENFHEDGANVDWNTINAGLTSTQYSGINYVEITPSGGVLVAKRGGPDAFIAYAVAPGQTFTILEDQASIFAKFPSVPNPIYERVHGIGVDPRTGIIAYIIGVDDNFGGQARQFYIGTPGAFSAALDVTALMTTGSRGSLTFGANQWRLGITTTNSDSRLLVTDAAAASVVRNVDVGNSGEARLWHLNILDTATILQTKSGGLIRVTGNGGVAGDFTTILASDVNADIDFWDNKIACDPTGMYLMLSWNATGRRGKSSDGGATIVGIPDLPAGGDYAYDYAGGVGVESRWVAGRGIVRYSPDFGETWENKQGNLLDIAPIPSINVVKVVQQ